MQICSSFKKLRRFIRCSKCQAKEKERRNRRHKEGKDNGEDDTATSSIDSHLDQRIKHAFYSVADDPVFVSRKRFDEEFGPALGNALWKFLQGDDEMTMDLKSFERHAKFLKEMPKNTFAQMGMRPEHLLRACVETHDIMPSNETPEEIEFMHKLSEQMGTNSKQIIAWKDRNCPRLFQSIHEHVLNVFLGIPKSALEEAKLEESELLSRVQMFFLKHNLARKVFFDSTLMLAVEDGEEEQEHGNGQQQWNKTSKQEEKEDEEGKQNNKEGEEGWTKLYGSANQGLDPEIFQENLFKYEGSTVVVFQMSSSSDERIFVLAVDEQWKNSQRPFGGPYTVLFKFHPKFERIEAGPPALHCNFKNPPTYDALYFNGGTLFAVKSDLSNVKAIEAWGCAPLKNKETERIGATNVLVPEAQEIIARERKKAAAVHTHTATAGESEEGKKAKPRRTTVDKWAENPDKQLLEMAGFSFSDKRRRAGKK